MSEHPECPTCKRAFKSIYDYPQVKITEVRIPESGYQFDESDSYFKPVEPSEEVMQALCELPATKELLDVLLSNLSREVATKDLVAKSGKRDGYFKWAYKLKLDLSFEEMDYKDYYLSLRNLYEFVDGESRPVMGKAAIEIHTTGPNFGSAAGPSLMLLATLATITYEGVL